MFLGSFSSEFAFAVVGSFAGAVVGSFAAGITVNIAFFTGLGSMWLSGDSLGELTLICDSLAIFG